MYVQVQLVHTYLTKHLFDRKEADMNFTTHKPTKVGTVKYKIMYI